MLRVKRKKSWCLPRLESATPLFASGFLQEPLSPQATVGASGTARSVHVDPEHPSAKHHTDKSCDKLNMIWGPEAVGSFLRFPRVCDQRCRCGEACLSPVVTFAVCRHGPNSVARRLGTRTLAVQMSRFEPSAWQSGSIHGASNVPFVAWCRLAVSPCDGHSSILLSRFHPREIS